MVSVTEHPLNIVCTLKRYYSRIFIQTVNFSGDGKILCINSVSAENNQIFNMKISKLWIKVF